MRCIVLAITLLLAGCKKPAPEPVKAAIPATTKPGTTLTATPDPIVLDDGTMGETTINWTTTVPIAEIHLGTPDGVLFVRGGKEGTAKTGKWVTDGMMFYLQDAGNPNPGSAEATLGSLKMVVAAQ